MVTVSEPTRLEHISERKGVNDSLSIPIIGSAHKKQELTDAIHYCTKLMLDNGLTVATVSKDVSVRSKEIGQEMFSRIVNMIYEIQFNIKKEVIESPEIGSEEPPATLFSSEVKHGSYSPSHPIDSKEPIDDVPFASKEPPVTRSFSEDESSNYSPSEDEMKSRKCVPLAVKEKLVKLAESKPKWSIKSLARRTTRCLKRRSQLQRWKEQLKSGGSLFDKLSLIDSWVYDRYRESKEKSVSVTTKTLKQWAIDASVLYSLTDFKASEGWIRKFKKRHEI